MKKMLILVVVLSALLVVMAIPAAAQKPLYGSACGPEDQVLIESALAACTEPLSGWKNHGEKVSCASQAVWGALGDPVVPTPYQEDCASSYVNYWARNQEP